MGNDIAVIGAGVIGGAIVKSLLKSGYDGKIIATRRKIERIKELRDLGAVVTRDNKKAAKQSDITGDFHSCHSSTRIL